MARAARFFVSGQQVLKLTSDEEVMGAYTNGPVFRIVAGATIAFLILLSALLLVTTFLFPGG